MMPKPFLSLLIGFLSLFGVAAAFAQPVNDDCAGIIDLGEAPICPVIDTFTNVDATGSMVFSNPAFNVPSCFNGGQPDADVWFSFDVPVDGSVLDFEIIVSAVNGPNGPILQPQLAVYRGDCELDGLEELACAVSAAGETEVALELIGLTPGFTYYLRIDDWSATAGDNWGDFELCIKEPDQIFNMGEEPGSASCSGILYDSGGPDGSYQNNENHTFTICPDEPTGCISLDIAFTNIENFFDQLTIFEGDNTSGQQLWDFTGNGGSLSLDAGTDCLTFQFTSDFSVTFPGFEIAWQCSPDPCATTLFPCEVLDPIGGLPFVQNGQSTCGAGDDVQTGPCDDIPGILDGEDYIFTYFNNTEQCVQILLSGVDPNTGLSVYNDCPESASTCMAQAQNPVGDTLQISNLYLDPFTEIYIVVSNANCTDFNISMQEVPCIEVAGPQPVCENAILLNRCNDQPGIFEVSPVSSTNPDYFQSGVNDGCWPDTGAAHYTWLFFQAQVDGDFGFLAANSDSFEDSNIDIRVWGPITDFVSLCDFMANNQPIRSTAAADAAGPADLTGLIDTNPLSGLPVTDVCESTGGDGFVSTLPVQMDEFYLILLNDHSGNIQNGGITLDFGPTSPGVLDGLPAGSPLNSDAYTTVGTSVYNPQDGDYSCIQVTAAQNSQLGCAWASELVDFSQPFSTTGTFYFGTNNGGADGMCMVYHNDPAGSDACGILGGQIGAGTITNSLIIEFDTWQNADLGDPFEDHVAVNINGIMDAPISGPVTLGNIEDGQEHEVTFNWDPATNTYEIFFDGVLQITGVFDVINNCFGGESEVYCGYAGSTGGANNLQYVCTGQNVYPASVTDTIQVSICEGESYFAGGMQQTTEGLYTDIFPAFNGCDSILVTDLSVLPVFLDTLVVELCSGESYFAGGAEQTTSGIYVDEYVSADNCDSTIVTDLTFQPVYAEVMDVTLCAGESYFAGGVEQTTSGQYVDDYLSVSGCDSTVTTNLLFLEATAEILPHIDLDCDNPECTELAAGDVPIGAGLTLEWLPLGMGIIESGQGTDRVTVCGPDLYQLIITNTQDAVSCADTSSTEVLLDLSACSEVEIPSAFSPNGDGVNDRFTLVFNADYPVEILDFKIYNRWGRLIYDNENGLAGWDGTYQGEPAPQEVYAFIMRFLDPFTGEEIRENGEVMLLR